MTNPKTKRTKPRLVRTQLQSVPVGVGFARSSGRNANAVYYRINSDELLLSVDFPHALPALNTQTGFIHYLESSTVVYSQSGVPRNE